VSDEQKLFLNFLDILEKCFRHPRHSTAATYFPNFRLVLIQQYKYTHSWILKTNFLLWKSLSFGHHGQLKLIPGEISKEWASGLRDICQCLHLVLIQLYITIYFRVLNVNFLLEILITWLAQIRVDSWLDPPGIGIWSPGHLSVFSSISTEVGSSMCAKEPFKTCPSDCKMLIIIGKTRLYKV